MYDIETEVQGNGTLLHVAICRRTGVVSQAETAEEAIALLETGRIQVDAAAG